MTNSFLRWVWDRKLPLLCSVACAALSVWLAYPLVFNRETPELRISAGPDYTRRHAIAQYLCEEAAEHDLILKLTASAGSEDCLKRIKAGELDAAIVSNGVVVPDDDSIEVLGALNLEAVHMLVRNSLPDGPLTEIIRGQRVNLGTPGGTEWMLSQEFLAFSRLKLPTATRSGDIVPTHYGMEQLIDMSQAVIKAEGAAKEALANELPDCLMVLASMPSSVVQLLVEAADYRIVPIPATQAFLMDNMQDSHAKVTVIEREFLERATIPACCYFSTRGNPATNCETVGVRLLVVTRRNVPSRAIRPLMKTLFEGEFAHRIGPQSPRELATPYAIHPAAIAYFDREKPLAIAEALEWLSSGLSIFGAFSAGALSLYGLLWRRKARKPSDYYAEIRKLYLLSHGAEIDSSLPAQPKQLIMQLDDRLLELRRSLIEDICEGRIKGDQAVSTILALLKDARLSLAKLEAEANHTGEHRPALEAPAARAA